MELGVIKKLGDGLKILGIGRSDAQDHGEGALFSESALEKIQEAGGTAK